MDVWFVVFVKKLLSGKKEGGFFLGKNRPP
jgi:hypothetical protein